MKKIYTSIIVVNLIGIMIVWGIHPRAATIVNNFIEKDRLEVIKEKGVLTVIAPPKEVPFFFIDPETNEISGIDYEIVNEIAKHIGIKKIEVRKASFASLLEKFNGDNSIDISFGGIFITPESEKLVAFTRPVYKETEAIIVPKLSNINFMSDLKNSLLGVEEGTIFKGLAEKWKKDNLIKDVVVFDSTSEIFDALSHLRIDAALTDSILMNYHLSVEKDPTLRTLKGYTPQLQGVMGIAVKKNDVALLNALNKAINDMETDGTLYAILVKNGLDKDNMIIK